MCCGRSCALIRHTLLRRLISRANGTIERVQCSGMPLGMCEHQVFTDVPVEFHSGDTVLLTTDGLVEARRVGTQFLGPDGINEVVRRSQTEPTLYDMGKAILRSVRDYAGGKLQDDACMVLLRRD